MKIGVRIPAAGPPATRENLLASARWAEALGFHSVWVSDHVILPAPEEVRSHYPYDAEGRWPYPADTPWLDPLLALATVAQVAPSVSLGTSVLVAPLRHPVLLAKQIATLDYLSGGRVLLGIGAGWMREEFALLDQSSERRGARAAEMVAVMRALWRGERVEMQGHFYDLRGGQMAPTPVQEHLPIIWGGHSEHALRRVVACGDGWHPTRSTLEQLEHGMQRLRALCDERGRDFAELRIIARPGATYAIDERSHARHRELGIDDVVIDPPVDDPTLASFRAELERVAAVCGLTPR
ncbi:LLM class F420-dependent oxidoreductase [Haliangium ochraceum]|uniref:Luciferase-like, subgroup n=1 Tax=Haliangium ochraceum (strain DSM 14365 / JCM 11303 / SMP-2) TaxID=502025 RepID=D0LG55_HALO1|nr:LLM class F420-dependent oxidoreductase [Haliangium ochraceum]ACY18080.1 Luciferase-like, subgroup [Haliangium ochraceum DSM 14365]